MGGLAIASECSLIGWRGKQRLVRQLHTPLHFRGLQLLVRQQYCKKNARGKPYRTGREALPTVQSDPRALSIVGARVLSRFNKNGPLQTGGAARSENLTLKCSDDCR